MLNLFFGYKYFFYSDKGALVFKCVQKGFHLFKEEYIVADSRSAVMFKLKRRKYSLLRQWTIYNNETVIAEIKENSLPRALARMAFGHLCGFLRANYDITGRFDSVGAVRSYSRVFTYFRSEIDKPDAVESDTILIAVAVIFMRDMDKCHPWFN
jgi:hypothetical protein